MFLFTIHCFALFMWRQPMMLVTCRHQLLPVATYCGQLPLALPPISTSSLFMILIFVLSPGFIS